RRRRNISPRSTVSCENQSWDFLNSENSAGSEDKSGKKAPGSSSNSQTEIGMEEAAPPSKKKRAGRGGVRKNGDGMIIGDKGKEEERGAGESDHEIHIWTERERRKKMRNMFTNLHALLPHLPPKADKSSIVDEAGNYIKSLEQTLQKLQKQKLERLQAAATVGFDHESSVIASQKPVSYDSSWDQSALLADQGSSNNIMAIAATTCLNNSSQLSPATCSLRYRSTSGPHVNFQTWTSSNVVLNICGEEAQISVCSAKKPGLLTTICYVLEKHKIEVVSAHISSDCNRSIYNIQAHAIMSGASNDQFQETALLPVEEIYKQAAGEIMLWVSP
ncbi:hypothetical protein F2P56_028721, partial [Juglans regia]